MIWIRPTTEYSEFTSTGQRLPKYHLLGQWNNGRTWTALCDMKARQYDHFKDGPQSNNPPEPEKCNRCLAVSDRNRSGHAA